MRHEIIFMILISRLLARVLLLISGTIHSENKPREMHSQICIFDSSKPVIHSHPTQRFAAVRCSYSFTRDMPHKTMQDRPKCYADTSRHRSHWKCTRL